MKKWYVKVLEIEYQGRWAKCIMEGNEIIMEVEMFDSNFIDRLVEHQNETVSDAYKEGMYDGVEIARKEYGRK